MEKSPLTADYSMPNYFLASLITVGLLLMLCQLISFGGCSDYGDCFTYFQAWDSIKIIRPNEWRPPVYPLLLGGISEQVGRQGALAAMLILQWSAYIVALILLWDINRMLRIPRPVNMTAVSLLLLIPGFWYWNNVAVPESLCISGTILYIWLSGRYLTTRRNIFLLWINLLVITLIFTKPVFIILIPITMLAGIIAAWRRPKPLIIVISGMAAAILLTLLYALAFRHCLGVFALTRATVDNSYYCMREDGLIRPDEIADSALREIFIPFYEANPGRHAPGHNLFKTELFRFSLKDKKAMADTALRRHPAEAIRGTMLRFRDAASFSHFSEPEPHELPYISLLAVTPPGYIGYYSPFQRAHRFPIAAGWILWLCFSAAAVIRWRKSHTFPLLPMLVSAVYFSLVVVSIAGAQDSWSRLISPVTPLLVVMASYLAAIILPYVKKSLSGRGFTRG